jgi:hypothetical protein
MANKFIEWCKSEIASLEDQISALEVGNVRHHVTRDGKTTDVTDYYLAETKRKLDELTEILKRAEEKE